MNENDVREQVKEIMAFRKEAGQSEEEIYMSLWDSMLDSERRVEMAMKYTFQNHESLDDDAWYESTLARVLRETIENASTEIRKAIGWDREYVVEDVLPF